MQEQREESQIVTHFLRGLVNRTKFLLYIQSKPVCPPQQNDPRQQEIIQQEQEEKELLLAQHRKMLRKSSSETIIQNEKKANRTDRESNEVLGNYFSLWKDLRSANSPTQELIEKRVNEIFTFLKDATPAIDNNNTNSNTNPEAEDKTTNNSNQKSNSTVSFTDFLRVVKNQMDRTRMREKGVSYLDRVLESVPNFIHVQLDAISPYNFLAVVRKNDTIYHKQPYSLMADIQVILLKNIIYKRYR